MVTLHIQDVHVKILYLLNSLMFALYILSILLQVVGIVHGEDLSDLTSANHAQHLNRLSSQYSRPEITRCISGGSHLKSFNISESESNFEVLPSKKKLFEAVLKSLFEKYGQNAGEMSIEGLENLLTNIRLVGHRSACEDSSSVSKRKTKLSSSLSFARSNDPRRTVDRWTDPTRSRLNQKSNSTASIEDLIVNSAGDATLQSASEAVDRGNSESEGRDSNSDITAKCLDAQHFLRAHGFNSDHFLQSDDFLAICPSMIFLLDATRCSVVTTERNSHRSARDLHSEDNCVQLGCGPPLSHAQTMDADAHHSNGTTKHSQPMPAGSVWGYAIAACTVISAVGLVAVGIIPLMHKVIYNHLLQFLVALAIGSLAGDALLHLLPHALAPHDHGHETKHPNETESHHHGSHDNDEEKERKVIWLGLTSIAGIFLFFIVERLVGLYSDWRRRQKDRKAKPNPLVTSEEQPPTTTVANPQVDEMKKVGTKLAQHGDIQSCEEKLMVVHSSKGVRKLANEVHDEIHRNCDPGSSEDRLSWDHSRNTRGHQHGHSIPGSVASVAWMVIIGDGFHNFADGMAVGSAFASSLSDGLSTSIAVFCHELPHELGDFAMLLNAGMSAKQALIYNCVSSILCFFGMACGVAVGNIASSSQWIFALIAGMFLYIALVDMLPEMKSVDPKQGEHPLVHLGLQSAGMLLGIGVMLVIALFEGKIL